MRRRAIAAAAAVLGAAGCIAVAGAAVPAGADVTTVGHDNLRTSWDAAEPGLGPSSVTAADFGKLWEATLPRPDGQTANTFPNQLYAQPVVADGLVIVATEENQVDALDEATGALKWSTNLGPAWTAVGCGDLVPHIGITSTPVYDAQTDAVYLVTKTDDGPDAAHPHIRLHSLDAKTGQERNGWPVTIAGASTNSGEIFDPATSSQRTGLLLLDGGIYFGTASHCDLGTYVGYLVGVRIATRALTLWSSESGAANNEAGIWQSGGGPMSDGSGRIFVATGNGVSPAPGPGTSPPGTLAESVVRLAVNGDGTLTAKDYFSPADNAKLDQDDADLGSGGPIGLPDDFGTSAHQHLLLVAGKSGDVWLLDRDALGGTAQGPNGTDAAVSHLQERGVWGRAAAFTAGSGATAQHFAYLLPSNSPLQAIRVAPNGAQPPSPTMSVVATSAAAYGFGSGSPVVTSNGTDANSATLWVVTMADGSGTGAILQAFPAVPTPHQAWTPIFQAALGNAAKFIQPATDNGRVFVGTRDGRVLAYGRPTTAAINAPTADFGLTPVGATAQRDVTITAATDVQITSVAVDGPFTVGTPAPALPADLATDGTLTVPVTFSPTATGPATGTLHVTVANGDDYAFSLTGIGTADGLAADPNPLGFPDTPVHTGAQVGVTVQNTGATPATIQTVTTPAAPFSASGLPTAGTVIDPQQSINVDVLFEPATAGAYSDQLTIQADTGSVTIPLHAQAVGGSPHAKLAPTTLAFGNVEPGTSRSLAFTLTNDGTAPLHVTKAAPPSLPFQVPIPIAEGQELEPGDSLTVRVTLTPTTARPLQQAYSITTDDGVGARRVSMTANPGGWQGPLVSAMGCAYVAGTDRTNGTPVVSSTCNGSNRQQFSWGAQHSLRAGAPSSVWCLTPAGTGLKVGTAVQLWHCDGRAQQAWSWDTRDRLVNSHSGLCLTVAHGSSVPRTPLVLQTCGTAPSQVWDAARLLSTRGQVGSGVGAAGQLCMANAGGRTRAGNAVVLAGCGGSGQEITYTASTLRVSGGCVAAAGRDLRSAIWWVPCSGATAQVWQHRSDGTLYNPSRKLCIGDPGNTTKPGTQLELWTCNKQSGERWKLPI